MARFMLLLQVAVPLASAFSSPTLAWPASLCSKSNEVIAKGIPSHNCCACYSDHYLIDSASISCDIQKYAPGFKKALEVVLCKSNNHHLARSLQAASCQKKKLSDTSGDLRDRTVFSSVHIQCSGSNVCDAVFF